MSERSELHPIAYRASALITLGLGGTTALFLLLAFVVKPITEGLGDAEAMSNWATVAVLVVATVVAALVTVAVRIADRA
jgi:hypothetical protein